MEQGWGDGVPLLPPTDERVAALCSRSAPSSPTRCWASCPPIRYGDGRAGSDQRHDGRGRAGRISPRAGGTSAILVPEWNAFALTTTTSSVFPMLIVNGPSRDRLHIDYRAGCLGGAAGRGSMTIGRAVSLCLRNIGGQRAGDTSRTVFGQPARFGLCFGEWEERSPWPSLAQRRGFGAGQEVVTVHGGKGTYPLADMNNDDPRDLAYTIAKSLAFPMNNWFLELTGDSGQLVLLVNPMWAERLRRGLPDRGIVPGVPLGVRLAAARPLPPAQPQVLEDKGRVDAEGRVRLTRRPDQFVPVVCGGLGGLHGVALTSFLQSEMQSVAVTRPA